LDYSKALMLLYDPIQAVKEQEFRQFGEDPGATMIDHKNRPHTLKR
jgi:hypothetical protein